MSMTALWLKKSKVKKRTKKPVDAHLAVKEVKSSCVILVVESFDRMSLSASSLMSQIPSFQRVSAKSDMPIGNTHCCCQRIH